jgi:hypothetical protein
MSRYTHAYAKGETRCSSYSLLTSVLNGVSGQRHVPGRALAPGKGTPVPLYRRLGGLQSRRLSFVYTASYFGPAALNF